ncbi:MAG TPA: GatB/YqeY domain-containing protein [Arenibaculum sp.]|nr:GatB/YqeY domain-containing protein [Arenibaculum sp.]
MDAAVAATIAETGAASPKDMGRVMALLKERHGGAMDFSAASAKVKAKMAG